MRFLILIALLFATASVVRAEAPATRPTLPPLLTDKDGAVDFVADGVLYMSGKAGWAFHAARRGDQQVCVIFDPFDGTPLYLSDGSQTLVYDLVRQQIMLVSNSRATASMDWDIKKPKPLDIGCGVSLETDPAKLANHGTTLHLDKFLATAALQPLPTTRPAESSKYIATREEGKFETIELSREPAHWARFVSAKKNASNLFYVLATYNEPIADKELLFPDLAKLRQDINLVDVDGSSLKAVGAVLKGGQALVAKLAVYSDADVVGMLHTAMINLTPEELARRDRIMGEVYRGALAKVGISYRPLERPTTQP